MADLIEEAIMNPEYMGCIPEYRRFRIEYGYECSCPEGIIYLPPEVNPSIVEDFLNTIIPKYKGCKKLVGSM